MKVGLVRRGWSEAGGAERYLHLLAGGLVQRGHQCVLFGSDAWTATRFPFGEIRPVDGRSPRRFADGLAAADPHRSCDLVFSLERVWSCDCYRAGDGVHRAWLDQRARYEPRWKGWLRSCNRKHQEILRIEERLFRRGSTPHIIANSHRIKAQIVRIYGYPAEAITVIHNGVMAAACSSAEQRSAARASFSLEINDVAVAFVGSGWERKGLRFALDAVAQVQGCAPVLLVAGRGDESAYRPSPRVRFLGPLANTTELLRAADLFILPTIYEPFSNACLEAAAAGLPVITTVQNGFSEIMEPGLHGTVIDEPADTERLARAIETWSDGGQRSAAQPALARLAATFNVDRNVTATIDVLAALSENRL